MDDEKLAWFCAGHWLKCLYDDFLHKRLAGEQMPCELCERKNECNTCPPINFIPLMEKSRLKMKTVFNVEENTHYPS
ncbi:MAG: hypothetical protein ACOCM4_13575 [Acetivibrio ethanolgignens]